MSRGHRPRLPQPTGPTRLSGGPGSGKTRALAGIVARRLETGADPGRVVVVTSSHTAGAGFRDLLDAERPSLYAPPRLFTHERLARWVLETVAGVEPTVLSRVGEWVAMGAALERASDRLGPLLELSREPGCVEDLLEVCGALKQALVGPGLLAERLAGDQGALAELTVAAAAYQTQLESMGAIDTKDLAGEAIAVLERRPQALRGWADLLVVDQGEELTPAQWYLIRELIARLAEPRAAIIAGDPAAAAPEYLGPTPRCFEELLPRELGPEEWRMEAGPTPASALARLWEIDSSPVGRRFDSRPPAAGPDVRLWWAEDDTGEAFAVAREIRRARLDDELEYDQVAVVAPPSLLGATSRALATVGVPSRLERSRWSDGPEASHLLDWLTALCNPADDAAVGRLLENGLGAPSPSAVLELRRRAARGRTSLAAALRSLAGVAGPSPIGERARLWRDLGGGDPALAGRALPTGSLQTLLGTLEVRLGLSQFALHDFGAAAALAGFNLAAADAGAARERLGLPRPTLSVWLDLLRAAVSRSGWDAERPPDPRTAEVCVLTLGQSKGRHWRRVYLTGVAEGLLPGGPPRPGLLSPESRQRLVDRVPELEEVLGSGTERAERERRRLVLGLSRATEQMIVCGARRYADRRVGSSPFLEQLERMGYRLEAAPQPADVTESDCVAALAARLAGGTAPAPAGVPAAALELAMRLEPWDPAVPSPPPGPLRLTASSLRCWLACPRLYHYHSLRLPEVDTRAAVQGTAAHQLLDQLYREPDQADTGEEFRTRAAQLLRAEILPWVRERLLDPLEALSVGIWLDRFIARWARRVVDAGPGLVGAPASTEVAFSLDRDAYHLAGRVDAVWRLPSGEVELVDFKTGAGAPPSRAALVSALLGEGAAPPRDWQLAIYQLAAESGALDPTGLLPPPVAVSNWYIGLDPSSRVPTGLTTRGFRLGEEGEKVRWHEALLTPEMRSRFASLLDEAARAVSRGHFPRHPRHDQGTCLSQLGCDWGDSCDGAVAGAELL